MWFCYHPIWNGQFFLRQKYWDGQALPRSIQVEKDILRRAVFKFYLLNSFFVFSRYRILRWSYSRNVRKRSRKSRLFFQIALNRNGWYPCLKRLASMPIKKGGKCHWKVSQINCPEYKKKKQKYSVRRRDREKMPRNSLACLIFLLLVKRGG